jgi:hypothetical protein
VSALAPAGTPETVNLSPSNVLLRVDQRLAEVPVTLTQTTFRMPSSTPPGRVCYRYRLEGATGGVSVLRDVWSVKFLSGFTAFSVPSGESFLLWFDESFLCYVNVSEEPVRQVTQISGSRLSTTYADEVIPLVEFARSHEFWGRRADNCELGLTSARLDAAGTPVLTMTNIFGKQFVFSKQGQVWQASDGVGKLDRR